MDLSYCTNIFCTGNSSLLAELEQSGVDCSGVVAPSMTSEDVTPSTHDVHQVNINAMWKTAVSLTALYQSYKSVV